MKWDCDATPPVKDSIKVKAETGSFLRRHNDMQRQTYIFRSYVFMVMQEACVWRGGARMDRKTECLLFSIVIVYVLEFKFSQ